MLSAYGINAHFSKPHHRRAAPSAPISENTIEDYDFICVFWLATFARLAIFAVRRCTPFSASRNSNLRVIVRHAS
jgi:hypothetical protein